MAQRELSRPNGRHITETAAASQSRLVLRPGVADRKSPEMDHASAAITVVVNEPRTGCSVSATSLPTPITVSSTSTAHYYG
ncbi:hypothetical protein E2C01_087965 [Portunus trituberculatus]|uniref:Uncharacterized protein n=1 Tax=Portunus trituberculatus TaxID=210409 RepID=A0A5B7JKQ5_PORTR|nr:hypothetical protein [Portunus trituberculatus]